MIQDVFSAFWFIAFLILVYGIPLASSLFVETLTETRLCCCQGGFPLRPCPLPGDKAGLDPVIRDGGKQNPMTAMVVTRRNPGSCDRPGWRACRGAKGFAQRDPVAV
jgi:hypothetical protein